MTLPKLTFHQVLALALTVGCLTHPASSAVGLLIVCASQITERYFTRNITDADRTELEATKADLAGVKADVVKLKESTNKAGIAQAFSGNR